MNKNIFELIMNGKHITVVIEMEEETINNIHYKFFVDGKLHKNSFSINCEEGDSDLTGTELMEELKKIAFKN